MPRYRLGELFCGPGGIAYGATTAKIDNPEYQIVHQWATDYDPDTCNTYRYNICSKNLDDKSVICKDIRKLDITALSGIDALAFGFPCNDYSVVGEQNGIDGVFGPLYSYGITALKHFKPKWFLAENVGGLRNANDGKALTNILEEMRSAGYTITPHLYKFEEYGVPQARHRIIIVGIRNDEGIKFKVPSTKYRVREDNSCRTAIEKPPIPEDAANNEFTKQSATVIRRLEHIKAGENAFNANLPDDLKLNVTGAKISQIYKRLDPDKPAYTVTGSGGGGTHIYHWSEPRALTNRERARLQTFPDTYVFKGSKESVRKQIGMAVPCDGVRIILEAILKTFAGIPYESIEENICEAENDIVKRSAHYSDFCDAVLFDPIREGANHLKIISGYATHTMASWHITEIKERGLNPIDITLVVGMCPFDGIRESVHKGFNALMDESCLTNRSKITCQYIIEGKPVHSKLYIWEKNGVPIRAFMGSANYTQSAFSKQRRELIQEFDPDDALVYFESVERDSMYCNHAEIEDKVILTKAHPTFSDDGTPLVSVRGAGVESVTLTLLARNGETGTKSGLNWGQRAGREPNQAYIPLPIDIARSDFFPLHKQHFSVLTDDGNQLILRVEQQNDKAITTPLNNSLIGEYFRRRIGVANGAYIQRKDLEAYGRTDVTFYKLDDEQYVMDFSV